MADMSLGENEWFPGVRPHISPNDTQTAVQQGKRGGVAALQYPFPLLRETIKILLSKQTAVQREGAQQSSWVSSAGVPKHFCLRFSGLGRHVSLGILGLEGKVRSVFSGRSSSAKVPGTIHV